MQHRFAAILALDVVGYSRLMGIDEIGTHARLVSDFEMLAFPAVFRHGGRIERVDGDGFLAEFADAASALAAATHIQAGTPRRNASRLADEQIRFRIGLHAGNVHSDGAMIFGEAVNIAARLEGHAEPGGMCVSADMLRITGRDPRHRIRQVGKLRLKNIAFPVGACAITLGPPIAGGPRAPRMSGRRLAMCRIAVAWRRRAFRHKAAAFAFGVMAAIVLTEVQGPRPGIARVAEGPATVTVLARTTGPTGRRTSGVVHSLGEDLVSALPMYPGVTASPAPQLQLSAPELGYHTGSRFVLVLDGRRIRVGSQIEAALVDAATGQPLWSASWGIDPSEPDADYARVMGDIVHRVGHGLDLGGPIWDQLAAPQATAADTVVDHANHAKGRRLLNDLDRANNTRARVAFEYARAGDPSNPTLLADLARTHLNDYRFGWTDGGRESLRVAEALARRAAELDPGNFIAARTLGAVYLAARRHDLAVPMLRRALLLNPHDAQTKVGLGFAVALSGAPSAAPAMVPNHIPPPANARLRSELAWTLLQAGHAATARSLLDRKDSGKGYGLLLLALVHAELGDRAAAVREIARFVAREPATGLAIVERAFPVQTEEARQTLRTRLLELGLPGRQS